MVSSPISLREYARRRGVSAMAVSKAVKGGRLKASVVRDERGQPKIADPDLADREWTAATDFSKAPGYVKARESSRPAPPSPASATVGSAVPRPPAPQSQPMPPPLDEGAVHLGMGLAAASAAEKVWKARIAELDFRERSGELVDATAMTAKIADAFTKVRTRLLAVPTRARQQIPHLATPDFALLDSFIREALEELVVDLSAPAEELSDAPSVG